MEMVDKEKFNNEFEYAWKRSEGDKYRYAFYFYLRAKGLSQFEAIAAVGDSKLHSNMFEEFKLNFLHKALKND